MALSQEDLDDMFKTANEYLHRNDEKPEKELEDNCCNNCKKYGLLEDKSNGIIVCTHCGVINCDQVIDEGAEWNFGAEEAATGGKDPSRCGMPVDPFFQKSSCTTMIGGAFNRNFLMKRLQAQISMDYRERSRYHMFVKIAKMCENLSPTILQTVKHYYVKMAEEKLSRGNVRLGLIACCIFFACKKNKTPRSIKEICKMCDIETSVFNSAHKIFPDIMKNHIEAELFEESTQVDDLTSRFCSYLNLDRKKSCKIANKVRQINEVVDETQILIGKTPSAITAACIIYVTSHENISIHKKYISQQLNVSVVTLNKITNILKTNSHLFQHICSP